MNAWESAPVVSQPGGDSPTWESAPVVDSPQPKPSPQPVGNILDQEMVNRGVKMQRMPGFVPAGTVSATAGPPRVYAGEGDWGDFAHFLLNNDAVSEVLPKFSTAGKSPAAASVSELGNIGEDFLSGMTSPVGFLTLGLGAAPKVVQRVAAGAFALWAAKGAKDAYGRYQQAKTPDEKAVAMTDMVAQAAMAGLATKEGIKPKIIQAALETKPTEKVGDLNANEKGQVPSNTQQQHSGVSQGENVPADQTQVREGDSGQAGGGGSVQPAQAKLSPQEDAAKLGISYTGEQEMPGGEPPLHLFTDPKTGSTIAVKNDATAADLSAALAAKRQEFGISDGPGAAHESEIPTQGDSRVGARHESLNERAKAFGFDEIKRGNVPNPREMYEAGQRLYDSFTPEERQQIVSDLSKQNPHQTTPEEFSFLRAHQEELKRNADDLRQLADKEPENADLQRQAHSALTELDNFERNVLKPYGTAAGERFRSLQGEVDTDYGNFIDVSRKFTTDQGHPPTETQTEKLKTRTQAVRNSEDLEGQQKENILATGDKEFGTKPTDSVGKASSQFDKIAYEILKANPHFNEQELSDALAVRIKQIAPDLTPDQIEEITSKYGQSKPVSTDPTRLKLIDIKRQWQEQAKQRTMAGGNPPLKTGTVQAEPSAELRAEIKRTNEAKRRGGFNVTDPDKQLKSSLEAAKTRANNQIEDLQREISNRERAVKSKTGSPTDPELESLKAKLQQVRQQHQDVFGEIDTQALKDRFAGKTDMKFTPDEAKAVWEQARNRIANLKTGQDFATVISGLSKDLGLTPEQVMKALGSKPKVARATDEMWFRQSRTNKLRSEVNRYIQTADDTRLMKFVKGIPETLFGAKIGFGLHNLALPVTHGSSFIFKPTEWGRYLRYYGDNVKSSFGKSGEVLAEKTRQFITADPNYAKQVRSGLAVSTDKMTDAEQSYVQRLGTKLGVNADSAFTMLKDFRQKVWNDQFSRLSPTAKEDPEIVAELSKYVNTLTNGDTGRFAQSPSARRIFFAPQKMASEIKGTLVRPAQAVGTAAQAALSKAGLWQEPTAAQTYAAKMTVRNAAEIAATYLSMLAVNQAMNKWLGSKQQVNFTNPRKSDWLKFKVGDQVISPQGATLTALRMVASLGSAFFPHAADRKSYEGDALTRSAEGYGMGKLSPMLSPAVQTLVTKRTASGDVLPVELAPNEKPGPGKRQLGLVEYGADQFAPIPVSEAWEGAKTVMQQQGLSSSDIRTLVQGLISGGGGMLGLPVTPDDPNQTSRSTKGVRTPRLHFQR